CHGFGRIELELSPDMIGESGLIHRHGGAGTGRDEAQHESECDFAKHNSKALPGFERSLGQLPSGSNREGNPASSRVFGAGVVVEEGAEPAFGGEKVPAFAFG